jgi:hypothetical protein
LPPRNDCVADVGQTVRWECLGARLPANADAPAELTIPQPPPKTGEPGYERAVRKRDWAALSLSVDHAVEERLRITVQRSSSSPAATLPRILSADRST